MLLLFHQLQVEFDDNENTNLIKDIQRIKINNVIITEFQVLSSGDSFIVHIDEQYKYLLSPQNTNKIQAEFYELPS